ncbi:hypothetical protein AB0C96_35530 [Streptomyces sp. NPDC048506]
MHSARRFAGLACPLLMVSVAACTPEAAHQNLGLRRLEVDR